MINWYSAILVWYFTHLSSCAIHINYDFSCQIILEFGSSTTLPPLWSKLCGSRSVIMIRKLLVRNSCLTIVDS